MSTLNKKAAFLMKKYGAHAATDVTGFGILGHAKYLAQAQLDNVDFLLHQLPIIKGMYKMDKTKARNFKFEEGYSAETSGGLLICLPKEKATDFIEEFGSYGETAYLVGEVIKGNKEHIDERDLVTILPCDQCEWNNKDGKKIPTAKNDVGNLITELIRPEIGYGVHRDERSDEDGQGEIEISQLFLQPNPMRSSTIAMQIHTNSITSQITRRSNEN